MCKSIIIKVIYHGPDFNFWNYEKFAKYISCLPNSLNVALEKRKHGTNPLKHTWLLDDYEVEVTYERPYRGEEAKIKVKLEGRPENIEALENKIMQDAGEQNECISAV